MQNNADLAYDFEIEICGDVWRVVRTFDLARRIEAKFGAIAPLVARIERNELTMHEMARLLVVLIEDAPRAYAIPKAADVEGWLFSYGPARMSQLLAFEVYTLVMGNELLEKVIASKAVAAPKKGQVAGPFARAAASSGPTG